MQPAIKPAKALSRIGGNPQMIPGFASMYRLKLKIPSVPAIWLAMANPKTLPALKSFPNSTSRILLADKSCSALIAESINAMTLGSANDSRICVYILSFRVSAISSSKRSKPASTKSPISIPSDTR